MPIAVSKDGSAVYLTPEGEWKPARIAQDKSGNKLAFDGNDWKPLTAPSPAAAEKPAKSGMDYLRETVRSLAEGATFGWSQEGYAGVDKLTGKDTYEKSLKAREAEDAEISPWLRIPGNIAGAVGTTLATRGFGGGALGASLARLPNTLRLGGLGAVEGGLFGAGTSPDDRVGGAVKGAAIGGVTGAAAPHIIQGGARMLNRVRHGAGPEANVAGDLGRAITRDNDTPDAILQRLQQARIDKPGTATLADVGGENVRGLTERIANTPGAGRTQVVPRLTQRQQEQAARVTNDLRSLTGTARTARQATDETINQRAAAARPIYDEAMQFDAESVPEILMTWENEVAQGWGRALLNSTALRRNLQSEYGVASVEDAPLMTLIDAWKKAADDVIRTAAPNQRRVITAMRDRVVGAVDAHNPRYADARNAWSGPSRYLDSIEEGRGILGQNVSAEEMAANFRALPQAEQEAYRIGAVSAIVDRMGNNPARLPDVTRLLRSPAMRAKIAAIMPDARTAAEWERRLNFEVGASDLASRSLGNSATARRLAERDDAEGLVADLVIDAIAGGGSVTMLRRMLTAGPRWLRDTLRSRADRQLGDLLTNPQRGNDLRGVLGGLNPPPPRPISGRANTLIATGATAGTAPR
jgi:hypothetical protein